MSKYVISDIHGMYDEFIKMLEVINFSDEDELFILGDIFDRGPNPLSILDYIVSHDNIHFIKGNHEDMFIEAVDYKDYSVWHRNGGNTTHAQIIERGEDYEKMLYDYIKALPFYMIVDNYILVHAGVFFPENYQNMTLDEFMYWQDEENSLWSRANIHSEKVFKDYKIICGHTIVQSITNNIEDVQIVKTPGHIYIDCGCCFDGINGKLACLRLDDMKEFYV